MTIRKSMGVVSVLKLNYGMATPITRVERRRRGRGRGVWNRAKSA